MRIKEKKFHAILSMSNVIFILIVAFIQVRLIQSDFRLEIPVFIGSYIIMSFYLLLSISSISMVWTRFKKLRQLKEQTLNVKIDTMNNKKYTLYIFIVYIILILIYAIRLANIYGVILMVNTLVWTVLLVGWFKLQDGVYDDILMFKGTIFKLDQIENIEEKNLDQNEDGPIEISLVYKFLWVDVIKTIELSSTKKDYEQLKSLRNHMC